MTNGISIFWFRRDLRLNDNAGFYHALTSGYPVLPIFIFDSEILDKLPRDDARVSFIHESLQKLNQSFKRFESGLAVYYGKPLEVYKELVKDYTIKAVYTNSDYEPYALERDQAVTSYLKDLGVGFHSFKDQVIFETDEIVKSDGTPYVVYTPYSKKWLNRFKEEGLQFYPSEKHMDTLLKMDRYPFLSLEAIGFKPTQTPVRDYRLDEDLIDAYEATRNYPAKPGTSHLGPHIRFGTVSIRKVAETASQRTNATFLKELVWREFFMQILWHFPHTVTQSFKNRYDRIKWRNDEQEFKAWCRGETGYPLVDAGMRELNTTGFMHNRIRMLVGSFLCKHLLIDWRWGEAYFAEKLHDYELASNVGNWQWVAGSGADAAPYFRIFNPTAQIEKFDKQHTYIKHWVPEYQELTYPKPIVDHKHARERCLEVYKAALSN